MLKASFSKTVKSKMELFTDFLRNYYRKFYNDSGLTNEDDIINMYINSSNNLTSEIINKIEDIIKKGIFGEITDKNTDYEKSKLVIFVRSYIIICYCTKYVGDDNIYIDDIFIKS